jgi:hypothetical protein
VLDITLAVNDQNLRVGRAPDWKTSGYHPIASCTIASESGVRRDNTAATVSASSRAATSGRFNAERTDMGEELAGSCRPQPHREEFTHAFVGGLVAGLSKEDHRF